MVGLPIILGLDYGLHRTICQVPGEGLRLPVGVFREALEGSRPLDALMRQYAAVVLR